MQNYYDIVDCIFYAVLYIPVTYLFCDWNFIPLSCLHLLHPFLHPLPLWFSVFICLFFSIGFIFYISDISKILWYLSFSLWLISLSIYTWMDKDVV